MLQQQQGNLTSMGVVLLWLSAFLLLFCGVSQADSAEAAAPPKRQIQDPIVTREEKSPTINDSGRSYNNFRGADFSGTVRALATFTPAHPRRVGVPSGGTAGGRRSLDDWEVEDFVLLATVDGTLHARDRKSGARRWEIFAQDPVVQTIHHRNASGEIADDDVVWIVEPVQDGALFFFTPDNGLQVIRQGIEA